MSARHILRSEGEGCLTSGSSRMSKGFHSVGATVLVEIIRYPIRAITDQPTSTKMVRLTLHCFRFCAACNASIWSACSGLYSVLIFGAFTAVSLVGESRDQVRGTVTSPVTVSMKKGKNCPCECAAVSCCPRRMPLHLRKRSHGQSTARKKRSQS